MYYYTFYFTRCQCIKQQIYMNNKAESFRRFVMEIVKRIFVLLFAMLLCVLSSGTGYGAEQERKYIKWVDFGITSQAMSDAAKIDCTSHGSDHEISWIELLSLLGVKYGGNFSRYKKSDLDYLSERIKNGENAANISGNPKLYAYYPFLTANLRKRRNTVCGCFHRSPPGTATAITTISERREATATAAIISVTI